MNEPGLGEVIDDSEGKVQHAIQYDRADKHEANVKHRREIKLGNDSKSRRSRRRATFKNEETRSIYQPTLWWSASTAFPLFAGTFGPIANLFSVCSLVQTWRITEDTGTRVPDPSWLLALNACSLALALIANFILLFNFARRIRYLIAQPITITLWYFACVLLAIPLGLSHNSNVDPHEPGTIFSQAYYYALISCVTYFTVSTLLLISTLGSTVFHAYEPSFNVLTGPQRTLMLQTISFTLYLALGAGVFSHIEKWGFADGVYWADYTLLTIGLGSDFPLTTTLARMLVIPYAAFGITLIGLVVSSVRGLVLERAKTKVVRRHLGKEREKWKKNIEERRQLALSRVPTTNTHSKDNEPPSLRRSWLAKKKERDLMRLPQKLEKHVPEAKTRLQDDGRWHRAEFELMRFIEAHGETTERYTALSGSFFVILIVWLGGSLVFWSCEHRSQDWSFTNSFYFSYTTLLTIGYGDYYPTSPAGKPFFVVWSLISVPAMTVLISNMGDTVVLWIENVTVWASRKTILPERNIDESLSMKSFRKIKPRIRRQSSAMEQDNVSRAEGRNDRDGSITSNRNNPSGSDTHFRAAHADDERGQEHQSAAAAFQADVEQLGEDVEEFEEDEEREGSLAARIAKEISVLARDLGQKPPKKYTWEEWSKWLDMLGEKEDANKAQPVSLESDSPAEATSPAAPVLVATPLEVQFPDDETHTREDPAHDESQYEPSHATPLQSTVQSATTDAEDLEKDWHWTWLSDHGPLFSHLSETEWIIEKLCFRLEEVLKEEIKEARKDDGNEHR